MITAFILFVIAMIIDSYLWRREVRVLYARIRRCEEEVVDLPEYQDREWK